MAFPIKNFSGKLNNKNTYSFLKHLDIGLCQKDRINLVNDLLYTQHGNNDHYLDPFYETYFDKKYKFNPSQDEYLSSENNVCQSLEKMANYILFADDVEKPKKLEYSFFTINQLRAKYGNDLSVEDLVDKTYKENNASDISFLINEGLNYKKEIKQTITSKDINELKPIRDYEDCKILIYNKLIILRESNKKKDSIYRKRLSNLISGVKTDQIICKDKLKGTIYFKSPLKESTDIDYDAFDFLNFEHVKALMACSNNNVSTDLGCLVFDLNSLLGKIDLTDNDRFILDMYRNNKTQEYIAKELEITQQSVNRYIGKICDKLIKMYFKDFEDWYYLNIVKGKYKVCSKCGQIKLSTKTYFTKKNDCKDKLHPYCKKCR